MKWRKRKHTEVWLNEMTRMLIEILNGAHFGDEGVKGKTEKA